MSLAVTFKCGHVAILSMKTAQLLHGLHVARPSALLEGLLKGTTTTTTTMASLGSLTHAGSTRESENFSVSKKAWYMRTRSNAHKQANAPPAHPPGSCRFDAHAVKCKSR